MLKNKSIKRASEYATWLIGVIICFSFISCQPSPDNPAVIGKSDTEKKIQQSTVDTQGTDLTEGNNIATTGDGKPVWKDSYKDPGGIFSVNINAEIHIPNVQKYPVVRIRTVPFNNTKLKQACDVFFGNRKIYNGDVPMTKQEIQQAIVEWKEKAGNPQTQGWTGAMLSDGYLTQLEEDYRNAPESVVLKEAEPVWSSAQDGGKKASLMVKSGGNMYERITGAISDSGSYLEYHKSFSDYQISGELKDQPIGITLSKEDSKKLADAVMSKLGLIDFQLAGAFTGGRLKHSGGRNSQESTGTGNECFVLCYTRMTEGIPSTYVQMASGESDTEGSYAPRIPKEYLEFYITDSGIVRFQWNNPYEKMETVSDNVKLLSLKDIQDIFLKQMKIQGEGRNKLYGNGTKKVTSDVINVYRISLNMMPIIDRGNQTSYLCIPVWDFFVRTHREYSDGTSQDGWDLCGNDAAYSILTVNAFDGSIINRNLGY